MLRDKEWLKTLKAGDEVCIDMSPPYRGKILSKVSKITPSGMIVVGASRFKDGKCHIDSWSTDYLVPATDEVKKELRLNHWRSILARTKWGDVSYEQAEKILTILKGGA